MLLKDLYQNYNNKLYKINYLTKYYNDESQSLRFFKIIITKSNNILRHNELYKILDIYYIETYKSTYGNQFKQINKIVKISQH